VECPKQPHEGKGQQTNVPIVDNESSDFLFHGGRNEITTGVEIIRREREYKRRKRR
jgi:hypothetical protein